MRSATIGLPATVSGRRAKVSAAEQPPARAQLVGGIETDFRHDAALRLVGGTVGAGLFRPHAVVVVVEPLVAHRKHHVRAHPQAPAPERVLVSQAQFAAAGGLGHVAQQLGEGEAPGAAELPAHAAVDAVLARRHPGEALGDVVGRMAFEAVPEEDFEAPLLRGAEFQADAGTSAGRSARLRRCTAA